ncbi:DegV family protein [Lactobacillus kefiranofaciens]|uniref:DegV family protein n=2 Tax=Lactobacillus kefiranofaciens TaxID=267818 RepID=A0AAX3UFK8_9LACO|nr:DegV family protein [Lactobacillus kefiranofaciens]MCJ2172100.1 DegV family protein [Lactobacillus kefiranofaciens]MCP9329941.1 DegV family protein [Lactobacillus kefiranofaciens]PAK98911.1 fatty acid-binding protein DegV [Lactobacillus kefiranofaciens]QFQ67928.1 DegV family protein [Lactobacillus kefiranofaciens subsp. kefiranofaciens]QNT43364.1 DegV family protein [Lactobacillus kefiranofaciens]
MSKIKVMTDSSVQLTSEEIKKYNITVVPLTITIDGQSYVDGVDITRSDFVKKMNAAKNLPKTSQPPIGRFVDAIKKLTADGSQVIGIFLAKTLSGTIDAARQAAEIAGQSENMIIFDSELTDRAEGFQVLAAARDAQAGKSMDEIIAHVKQIRNDQKLEMMVVNLKNLIKGGRLGALSGRIATMLNIRIALQMPKGELKVAKKGRGKKFTKAFNERVLKEITDNKDRIKEVGLSYVDTPELMQELANQIKAINPKIDVLVAETSPIIATHAGNGAYAILYYME